MIHCGFVDFKWALLRIPLIFSKGRCEPPKFGCTSYLNGPKEALKIWEWKCPLRYGYIALQYSLARGQGILNHDLSYSTDCNCLLSVTQGHMLCWWGCGERKLDHLCKCYTFHLLLVPLLPPSSQSRSSVQMVPIVPFRIPTLHAWISIFTILGMAHRILGLEGYQMHSFIIVLTA